MSIPFLCLETNEFHLIAFTPLGEEKYSNRYIVKVNWPNCNFVSNKENNIATQFFFAVVSQSYTANVMDESVLKGNTAIFKCHIPSFVSDYVYVTSWLRDDGHEILLADGMYGA